MTPARGALVLVIVALGASAAAESPPEPPYDDLEHAVTTRRLPNGLTLVLAPDQDVSSAVVTMRYHVGSADDPPGRAGLAHLIEHAMSRRSQHVADVDKLLDDAGGWSVATTTAGATSFLESVPAGALELALYLEADRMAGPAAAVDLEAPRRELAGERDDRQRLVEAALWPARAPSLGTAAELAGVTADDLASRWRDRYDPGHATLVIAGRFDAAEVRALVKRYFGSNLDHPRAAEAVATVAPLAAAVELAAASLIPRVTVTFRTGSTQLAELAVAARLLGTGHGSWLYRRLVVVDRVATDVSVAVVEDPRGGELTIEVALRDGAQATAARTAIRDELARLRAAPIGWADLERARNLADRELLGGLENLAFRASQIAAWTQAHGPVHRLARLRKGLALVTGESLADAARQWLADTAAVTLISGAP